MGTNNYSIYLVDNTVRAGGMAILRDKNIPLDRYFNSALVAQ